MSGNESGPEIGAAPVPEPSAPVPEPSRPPGPPEKRVSWGELFFDLVFVFAVTETSTLLAQDHSVAGLVRALIVFVPVYWVWVGTSVQANLHDVDRPRLRLGIFAIALAGLFMALALPDVYGDRALLFAGSYWGARLVLGGPMNLRGIWHAHPYSVSMFGTGPMFVVGALLHGPPREAIWAAAALIDLSTPTVLRSRLKGRHYDAAHLSERFGLFVLIALGESIVAIGASAQSDGAVGVGTGFAVAASFALSCGLWWVYFHFAADAVRHALATARIQLDIMRLVFSYGHLSFIAAIIVATVGMKAAVAAPARQLGWSLTGLLFGATAAYLATFGFTRWVMFRLVSVTRLTAAGVVLIALPAARYVPALAALIGLAVILAVLNVVEFARVERIGWRAVLARRTADA